MKSTQTFFCEVEEYLKMSQDDCTCMMAIDIEHFRLYNKIHGEEDGNELLSAIADILKRFQSEHGGVVGHMGGDNFVLVAPYVKDVIKELCDEIREEIRLRKNTNGYPPAYGIYVIKDKNENVADMYNRAAVALSYVIGNYTNRCCEYTPEMDGKLEEEIRLLSEIQGGIDRDEFTFYLQPQYDIEKKKIVGGESLVRWIHHEKGLISPGVFIPVLEKNGFIADLDQIVWDKVCAWLKDCIEKGYKPVPVSINVSRIDIFSLDVPAYLISLVEKYDIPADLLKVEITESAYAQDEDEIVDTVHRLQEYGFIVMMDDFGSGYSSLNMLKSVPVDVLKMDMRFLEINENEEEKGIGILESVINMARQMRIPIVVEGVETQAQENLLRRMGCIYTQGFYYYRPMPLVDFEEILSDDNNLDHGGFWYKQAESVHLRELMDRNLFNDTVVNNILGPAVFYEVFDNTIEITRVNEQYFKLAGISRQEEVDYRTRFWNSVRDDDRQRLYSIFAQAYEKPAEGASGFINLLRRDGVNLWVNIHVFFLREKEGHKLFYASMRDMTDVKADTVVPSSMEMDTKGLTEKHFRHMEKYYGNIPSPLAVGTPVLDENNNPVDYIINYANKELSRLSGGDMERLRYLVKRLFQDKEKEFMEGACRAAFDGESVQLHIYSTISNRYFDVNLYQYEYGYACCMITDVTHSHIYEKISGNIMESFREVYFLHLNDNYCRLIYPSSDDMMDRGNYEEVVNRHFESGKICPYDEHGVREFLSLENLRRELRKTDSVEYKYKRSIEPAGEEWCITTVSVSERRDGLPRTATVTIRSIEGIMREREDRKRQNMAQMLGTMSDGFFVYDAEGEETIRFANPRVFQLFGCKTEAEFKTLTGNTFPGIVHPDDVERVQWEIHNQVKESDRNMDFIRYRIIRKDGEVRWIDDAGHLETSEFIGGSKMFYVFISDVTDSMTDARKNKLIEESKRFHK